MNFPCGLETPVPMSSFPVRRWVYALIACGVFGCSGDVQGDAAPAPSGAAHDAGRPYDAAAPVVDSSLASVGADASEDSTHPPDPAESGDVPQADANGVEAVIDANPGVQEASASADAVAPIHDASGTGVSPAPDSGSSTDASSSSTSCGFDPVTPNATTATRKVLCYLHSIYGNHILSGQEENNDDNGINTIYQATGKYPAIRAFDVNNSMAPTQCVSHWKSGGLCMFGYHMGINGASFSASTNIDNVLTTGTSENKSFNQDLDRIAQYVQPVQAAGGVAIIRLFHEAGNNCAWFWWSKGTSNQWQNLFKYAFNYLTGTKGLNNTLWIAPLCGSPTSAYNPGSKYIDFGGADDYVNAGDYEPLTNLFKQTESAFPNMMVALHECGPIPDPAQLKSSGTKWLFFNVWSGTYISSAYNPASHLQSVYSNEYVITRDRLPSFK